MDHDEFQEVSAKLRRVANRILVCAFILMALALVLEIIAILLR